MKKNQLKKRLVMAVIAFLLLTVGSTYAWWTASQTVEQKISMGRLKVEADFKQKEFTDYEPGLTAEIVGTIKNAGTIDAMVRVSNNSQITFAYSDDNMTAIPEDQQTPEEINPDHMAINVEPASGDYSAGKKVYWLQDSSGNKYLLMTPNSTIKVKAVVAFNGEALTNRYMDSTVKVQANINATQVLEGAGKDVWGISFENDLVNLPLSRIQNQSDGRAYLLELLARGKQSG